jgi:hypothetical protein
VQPQHAFALVSRGMIEYLGIDIIQNCPPSESTWKTPGHARPERRVQSAPGHARAALSDSGLI